MSSERYARITADPPWTSERALQIIQEARMVAARLDTGRILFDLRRWDSPSSQMVRYDSGVFVAQLLNLPYRIAALANEEVVNYFGETVAVNRGADLRVFTDEAAALAWLLE